MPFDKIAATYDFSIQSLRRHKNAHVGQSILQEVRLRSDQTQGDLLMALSEVLDDVSAVRSAALIDGDSSKVLRAASAATDILKLSLSELKIDDLSIAQSLKDAELLATAVGILTRKHPDYGVALAIELRGLHADHTADELERVAKGYQSTDMKVQYR